LLSGFFQPRCDLPKVPFEEGEQQQKFTLVKKIYSKKEQQLTVRDLHLETPNTQAAATQVG
jgi:hypothetical protein